jgi:hypothetical protein
MKKTKKNIYVKNKNKKTKNKRYKNKTVKNRSQVGGFCSYNVNFQKIGFLSRAPDLGRTIESMKTSINCCNTEIPYNRFLTCLGKILLDTNFAPTNSSIEDRFSINNDINRFMPIYIDRVFTRQSETITGQETDLVNSMKTHIIRYFITLDRGVLTRIIPEIILSTITNVKGFLDVMLSNFPTGNKEGTRDIRLIQQYNRFIQEFIDKFNNFFMYVFAEKIHQLKGLHGEEMNVDNEADLERVLLILECVYKTMYELKIIQKIVSKVSLVTVIINYIVSNSTISLADTLKILIQYGTAVLLKFITLDEDESILFQSKLISVINGTAGIFEVFPIKEYVLVDVSGTGKMSIIYNVLINPTLAAKLYTFFSQHPTMIDDCKGIFEELFPDV